MLTREENDQLTRIGAGTPMGALMRRYWLPVVHSTELDADGPPVRVTMLGEKLLAWRGGDGNVGLIDPRCPHRGADLFFGRNEEQGIRCVYHGWQFDREGRCVDMPSEPATSHFRTKVSITAYPCEEHGSVVWAYIGPPALKPAFPALEWTGVPDSHRITFRRIQECNWFQAFEGGWDTAHLSFLHRGDTERDNRFFQRKGRDAVLDLPATYEFLGTDFGFVYGSGRPTPDEGVLWSVALAFMPCWKVLRPQAGDARYLLLGWVPIDDESTMIWSIEYHPDRPLNDEEREHSASHTFVIPEMLPGTLRPLRNRDNDYRVDRALQSSGRSFTGIFGIALQDSAIQESMGPIADRTREHLRTTDIAIVQLRRHLLKLLHGQAALPGLEPGMTRVRPAVFSAPKGKTMADVMDEAIHIDVAALTGTP